MMELEAENARLRAELAEARAAAATAEADAERRQRRDLVPLRQAVAAFGERPSIFGERAARDDRR